MAILSSIDLIYVGMPGFNVRSHTVYCVPDSAYHRLLPLPCEASQLPIPLLFQCIPPYLQSLDDGVASRGRQVPQPCPPIIVEP